MVKGERERCADPLRRFSGTPTADHGLCDDETIFRDELRRKVDAMGPVVDEYIGFAKWCIHSVEAIILKNNDSHRGKRRIGSQNEEEMRISLAAEIFRIGSRALISSSVHDICTAHEPQYPGNKRSRGVDPVSRPRDPRNVAASSTKEKGATNMAEAEAVHALLDFGRRVSSEQPADATKVQSRRIEPIWATDSQHGLASSEATGSHLLKHKRNRRVSVDSIDGYSHVPVPYEAIYHPPPYMMSTDVAYPIPAYFFDLSDDKFGFSRAMLPQSLSYTPLPLPASPVLAVSSTTQATSPPVHFNTPHSAWHTSNGYVYPAASESAAPETTSSTSPILRKQRTIQLPELWTLAQPVHGSRYVYEGKSCRLEWDQDDKSFGFECFERLRCKFFDARFTTLTTGDLIQLQDARFYMVLCAARDIVPRNHQYDTWMICYNFGGYHGMEVVFVELKWLASVLAVTEELPHDHPKVDYVMAEAVLHKFTKNPSFYRRHSSVPVRRRGSRGAAKVDPPSKPSDPDEDGGDVAAHVRCIHGSR